ncbi:hypothetical protein L1987_63311 [Smallanthus sonchifolius]|uniref:Uncharacterized protein n=1 Tax=Smallanthus sonchifolius TaxID=185202 RepID=A0ACB9CCX7_9ASTR|nr:hypothetical protein L1987_63311 [Smallanthus sonchifolius]
MIPIRAQAGKVFKKRKLNHGYLRIYVSDSLTQTLPLNPPFQLLSSSPPLGFSSQDHRIARLGFLFVIARTEVYEA